MAELGEMIVIMALGAAVQIGLNPVSALAYARERHFFMKFLESATLVITTIVTVYLLQMGHGPYSVVAAASLGKVLQGLIRIAYVLKTIGAVWKPAYIESKELRQVVSYAAPIFVSMVASVIFWKFDSILIGSIMGLAPIAIYSVGVTFNKYFMSAATALSRVMTPQVISLIDDGANPDRLTDEMIRISRIQALVLLLVLSGLIVYGQRFLNLWLGSEFSFSYWVMMIVLVPYTLELIGNARNIILQVKLLYWQKTVITLTMALLNIPLTIWFLSLWGVVGAAISTGIAILFGYLLVTLLLKLRVGISIGRYVLHTTKGIFPVATSLAIVGLLTEQYLVQGWLSLAMGIGMYTFVYVVVMYRFAMTDGERQFVNSITMQALGRTKPA